MLTIEQRIKNLRKVQEQAAAKLENGIKHKFSPHLIRVLQNGLIVAASNVAMAEAYAILDK